MVTTWRLPRIYASISTVCQIPRAPAGVEHSPAAAAGSGLKRSHWAGQAPCHRSRADLSRDCWIQSPECWPLHPEAIRVNSAGTHRTCLCLKTPDTQQRVLTPDSKTAGAHRTILCLQTP